ncbi:ABC transporter ATP-binding protein [Kribbella sp. CA-293567]|uniref:ABC transporter ATP-binding protein n=1 Tax=Kribbella sp. CA-293567 TaxID=3002436 RepID=UPI0022DDF0E5|nr:ABC transporter ATP-binding protein [Kribbella sp. CA-293567]WBQ04204.1 ABC transporter ATP-binding protein [Kribbella sp. CA-293567]
MKTPEPLAVRGLTKKFGGQRAVDDVSFTVPTGSIVGLLGPNGSGKSTTLHCITGFHRVTAGEVLINGLPHDTPAAKNEFGFFPDDLPVPESLTADETLALHRRLRPLFDLEFAEALTETVGLLAHRKKFVGDYSHGMRRKLQLVLALAHHPRLLILDEPLRGLDPEAGALMSSVIAQFAGSGGAVLIATHDLYAAERTCDEVCILSDGKLAASGRPADIVTRTGTADLADAFVAVTGLTTSVAAAEAAVAELLRTHRAGQEARPATHLQG